MLGIIFKMSKWALQMRIKSNMPNLLRSFLNPTPDWEGQTMIYCMYGGRRGVSDHADNIDLS